MQTSKHTKGPWRHDTVWNLILGPNKQEIAALHAAQEGSELRRPNRVMVEANARLIAASPELFTIVRQWELWRDDPENCEQPAEADCLAAIAKAEGKGN